MRISKNRTYDTTPNNDDSNNIDSVRFTGENLTETADDDNHKLDTIYAYTQRERPEAKRSIKLKNHDLHMRLRPRISASQPKSS